MAMALIYSAPIRNRPLRVLVLASVLFSTGCLGSWPQSGGDFHRKERLVPRKLPLSQQVIYKIALQNQKDTRVASLNS